MVSLRWLPIFILGSCFGYGLALFFDPDTRQTETIQPEREGVIVQSEPAQQVAPTREPVPQQVTLKRDVLEKPDHRKSEANYILLIRDAVAKREFTVAFGLLAEAKKQFGTSAPRLILLADIQRLRGNIKGARVTLHQALAMDPAAGQVYPMLRQVVTALMSLEKDALTFDEKVRMLSQEIIDDPGFAPYYILLGRLYYRHENYTDAITNLEYALQLDYTQTAKLSPLITAAKQRLENPGLVELPISSHGRSLNVDVKLNDHQQSFHFILDTGATYTAISNSTAQKLGIAISQDLPTIQVSTANGTIKAPVITLNAVNLQGALVEQVPAMILNELSGFDGLLGLSFLNHFNIDINQDEGKLLLMPKIHD